MARAQEIVIEVDGMTCAHCEQRVSKSLLQVPGVTRASASRAERRAIVTADAAIATEDELRAAVVEAGYTPGEILRPE